MPDAFNHKRKHSLSHTSQSTDLIDELKKANLELREARRAALNLMEDAILSKEALRQSEEKYRTKLEQDVRDRTAELQASKELLQATMDASMDMIQVFEAVRNSQNEIVDFRYILLNHEAEKWMPGATGKLLLQLQPGVVEEGIFAAFKEVTETGVAQQYEKHYVHEQFDGWFHQSVVKLNDGVATTTANITARKTAELEVQQSKTLLQDIINAPRIGMAVYKAVRNTRGEIVDFVHQYINQASIKMLGGEDFTGRLFTDHGENAIVQLPQFVEVIQSGKENGYTREALFRDRNVWFAITNTPLGDDRLLHTWEDVTERKQTEAEILRLKDEIAQKATDKYKVLFDSIDEGFAIQEAVTDEAGNVTDVIYREVNNAFEKHTGMKDALGRKVSEFVPHIEQAFLDALTRVYKTGNPLRGENYTADLDRWFSYHYSRIGGAGSPLIAVVFNDITERKQREKQQAFLLSFTDIMRKQTNAEQLQVNACELLGIELSADRVNYAEVHGEEYIVANEFMIAGSLSMKGHYPINSFRKEEIGAFRSGKTVVIRDIQAEPHCTKNEARAYEAINVRSFVSVPLVKDGKLIVVLSVIKSKPYQWKTNEVALIEDIAERTWSAVERAKVEEALKKSEEKYRTLFNSIDEGYLLSEVIFDEANKPVDIRYIEANPAAVRLAGHDFSGKRMREINPYYEEYWYEIIGRVALTGVPAREERYAVPHGKWFDFYAFKVGEQDGRRVAVVFQDITERKRREANASFLNEISQDLAHLTSIDETMKLLGEKMAAHFNLAAVAFAEITKEEMGIIDYAWQGSNMPNFVGTYAMKDFVSPEVLDYCRTGRDVVIRDVFADPRTDGERYKALNIGAFLSIPLVRSGEWRFLLVIYRSEPYDWNEQEIALTREFANRVWTRMERAKAEEALRESEARFKQLIMQAPIPILVYEGEQYVIKNANNAQLTVWGKTWEEIEDKTLIEIEPGATEIIEMYNGVFKTGKAVHITEYPIHYTKNGSPAFEYFNSTYAPLRNEKNEVTGIIAIGYAVTEQVEARKRLEASEQRLQRMINVPYVGVLTFNYEGEFLHANEAFLEMVGYSREEFDAQNFTWQHFTPPQHMAISHQIFAQVKQKKRGGPYEKEYYLKDGSTKWLMFVASDLGDGTIVEYAVDISERKRAEEALRQSEEQFRRSIQNAPVPVIMYAEDGEVLQISEAFTETTGLTLEQIPTFHKWMKYVIGKRVTGLKTHLDEVFWSTDTQRFSTEISLVTLKGEKRHWSFSVSSPGLLKDGRRFLVGMAVDISDRKKAEEAVLQSEERFRTLANAIPQIIWSNNEKGVANYFNQRWYDYSSLTYEQSVGLGWEAIVHPDDAPASKEKWQAALAAGEIFDTEYRLRRHDGQYCWHIGRNVPLKNDTGKIIGWFGSATDIEALKKAQDAFRQSETRLRITMESATDYAIITMDTERRIERWSSGAAQIFGYTEEEVIGSSADIIFTEEDRAKGAPQIEMETARDTGRAADERWHQRKDGSRFFMSGFMRPIYNEQLTGYVKVARDMTQQQLFTEELHRLVAERTLELQRSNEDLQQFATIASHDLQEPLRKLRLFVSVLQRFRESLPGEVKELLVKIHLTSERMSQLIREVLQFSKVAYGAQEFEPADLHQILQEVLADLDVLLTEAKATIVYNSTLPEIEAAPQQLTQLFYNLLTNAVKFRKETVPPEVRISVQPVSTDELKSFADLQQAKDYIDIVFSDNGIGFDPQFSEQIFQIFERLHSVDEYEGTGVGLALCKKIVENHNGAIYAVSREGEGASFHVILPLKQ